MSSRLWKKLLLAPILSSLVFAACTLGIGEDPLPDMQAKTSDSQCLGEIGLRMDRFFAAQASQGELVKFFNCVDTQLSLFVKSFVGSENKSYYTPAELKNFLESAYFEPGQITDELMRSLMGNQSMACGRKANKL